jgi:hypothetical protein
VEVQLRGEICWVEEVWGRAAWWETEIRLCLEEGGEGFVVVGHVFYAGCVHHPELRSRCQLLGVGSNFSKNKENLRAELPHEDFV